MGKNKTDFRLYADSAPFATLIYNETQKWIYANKEAEKLTGFSEQELLAQNFWEIVARKYQQTIKERGLARLKGDWPKDRYEFQIIRKNGETKWIEIHMNRIQLDDSTAIILGGIDIESKKKSEMELINSREQYQVLTDNLQEGIILLDETYTVEFVNPSVYQTFRRTPESIIGKNITQICHYEHRFKYVEFLKNAKAKGMSVEEFDFSFENNLLVYELRAKYLEKEGKFLLVMHDITDRETATKNEKNLVKLQNTFIKLVSEIVKKGMDENTYSRILKMAIDIVPGVQAGSVLIRDGTKFRFAAAIGYDFSLLKKISLNENELLQTRSHEIGIVRNLKEQNDRKLDEDRNFVLNTAGRTNEILEMLSIPIKIKSKVSAFFNLDNLEKKTKITESSIKIAKLFSDVITAIMQKNNYEEALFRKNIELKKLSNYDPLTNLANRRFLSENISKLFQEVKEADTNLYMLYMDLNNFKTINDQYGHDLGDFLLAEFAKRITEKVRYADMVSRIGGDEFLLIMTSLTKNHLVSFLNRFIEDINEPYFVNSKTFHISASIGISQFPSDGTTFQELLKKSDIAMYKAKKENLSFCFFNPS